MSSHAGTITAGRAGKGVAHYVALIVIGILSLFPVYFMVVTGLKDGALLSKSPFNIAISEPFGRFYSAAWGYLTTPFLWTIVIVVPSIAGILATGMLSSYAFARIRFIASQTLFYCIFGLLLIPGFLTLIPLFLEVRGMGLQNNPLGLILPYVAGGQAFAIFVLRSAIEDIPEELFEAARVDGASHLRMLWSIAIPLCRPTMVAVALLNLTTFWGDYVFPSLVMSVERSTVAMAIGNFQPPPSIPSPDVVNMQFAAYTLVSLPLIVIFIIFMRYFVAGMTSGALRM